MANWYLQNGKDSDVVISSRVRLARNLADFPFKDKAKQEDLEQILKKIKEIVPSISSIGLFTIILPSPSI